ncbi:MULTISPECIES: SPW repeat protein [Phyllobacteriaceae]|uniref:SPW repeat protein n=1 Tax=Phyllobacterium phragmitis TaxID=2670329 RepID=A0ABQ0H5D2_9HYPH|nr:SPW repeat protein [Mesorhizobium sp. RMAD-H1]MBB2974361.1 hypothetical protein [Mesorhizobium sp. RMAD-H1]
MQIIPTRLHGILDYLTAALLILAPWLFGFADGSAAQWVPVAMGAGIILYSLLTSYEWGILHVIPMRLHLVLDFGGGILLLASPWLFGFADRLIWPHVTVGAMEIVVACLTYRRANEPRNEWDVASGR